jgi:hypothetical protein
MDNELYREGFPHEVFNTLRREAPVWWQATPDANKHSKGPGFWVISKFDDVEAANRDTELFCAIDSPSISDNPEMRGTMLVSMDGKHHTRQRKIISSGFTPRMVGRLEGQGLGGEDRRGRARARDMRIRPGRRVSASGIGKFKRGFQTCRQVALCQIAKSSCPTRIRFFVVGQELYWRMGIKMPILSRLVRHYESSAASEAGESASAASTLESSRSRRSNPRTRQRSHTEATSVKLGADVIP